jgi:RHS repeat-associated protein
VVRVTEADGTNLGLSPERYTAWGGLPSGAPAGASKNPGYNGHESAGGLVYMRNRWYDPNTGRFTQQDPIGFAGGINLYGYAGGDPVNFSDPFGLSPDTTDHDPDSTTFNPLKFAVGAVNSVRGTIGMAKGAATMEAGILLTPATGGASTLLTAKGAAQMALGFANLNRGLGQMSEATNDTNGPSAKNLLGLLPFGQKYDDPNEPGAGQYFMDQGRRFIADPAGRVMGVVKDFFAIDP